MTEKTWNSLHWDEVAEEQELPTVSREITVTTVVTCAIASRDFLPLHHDREYAQKAGLKDIIINTPSMFGFASKYLTDWTGPEAELKEISLRLMVPCCAGDTLTMTGKVAKKYVSGTDQLLDIDFSFAVPLGVSATGKATLTLPGRTTT